MDPKKEVLVPDTQKLSGMGKLSLWLDDYNDIFSDFDPRPYSQRNLSDDFLTEAKKTAKEKASGDFALYLLAPAAKRSLPTEATIKKRLKGHFAKHAEQQDLKRKNVIQRGFFFIELGVVFMFITTFILVKYHGTNFYITFLSVILEPGGWFLFWEGLNQVIFDSKENKAELDFYRKMSRANIYFSSY